MPYYNRAARGEVIGGGISPPQRYVPFDTLYPQYVDTDASPVAIGTTATLLSWTVTAGMLPTLNGSSQPLLDDQNVGHMLLGAYVVVWYQNVGSTGNISVAAHHKHGGGVTEMNGPASSAGATGGNYGRATLRMPRNQSTWFQQPIVADDVVGVTVTGAAGTDIRIHHRALVICPAFIALKGGGYLAQDFAYRYVSAYSLADWKTAIGINAAWSSTTVAADTYTLGFPHSTSAGSLVITAFSTGSASEQSAPVGGQYLTRTPTQDAASSWWPCGSGHASAGALGHSGSAAKSGCSFSLPFMFSYMQGCHSHSGLNDDA